MKTDIAITVICMTYNHESFIEQALTSILAQEDCPNFEVLIHDDASTDKTLKIVDRVRTKHPSIPIRIITQKRNRYSSGERNLLLRYALSKAKGRYIALCEGDDYWVDKYKLSKQYSFILNNPEYSIHSGNAVKVIDNKKTRDKLFDGRDKTFRLCDFAYKNKLATCTVFFVNKPIALPTNLNSACTLGDWLMYVLILQAGGKAYRTSDVYSAYRVHSGGVFSSLNEETRLNTLIKHLSYLLTILKSEDDKSKCLEAIVDHSKQAGVLKSKGVLERLQDQNHTLKEENSTLLIELKDRENELNQIKESKKWKLVKLLSSMRNKIKFGKK